MRTSRRLLKQARRAVLTALILSAGINVLMLAVPLYTLQIFDTVVPVGSLETLVVLSVMVAAAVAALGLVELCRDRILLRAGLWLDHVLGQQMLANGLAAGTSPADIEADRTALATLRGFLTGPTLTPVLDAPWVPIFIVILALIHPLLCALAVGASAMLVLLALVHHRLTRRAQQESGRATERSQSWWSHTTASPSTMRALGLVTPSADRWEKANRQHIAASYALGKRTSIARAVARSVRIGALLATYGTGAWLVMQMELAPGALVAAALLLSRVLAPLEQLVGGLKSLQAAADAYSRLKSLPPDAPRLNVGAIAESDSWTLAATDVTAFQPGRRTPALRGINIEVRPGEIVGVVGPSGSGKTSLTAVLAGALAPASGAATCGGISVARWRSSLDSCPIAYLTDEPLLLDGTVHENIACFSGASLMSVARAAIAAGVHDVLTELPNGYDTEVGPRGTNLSSRERRAVAMARALHGAPRFVILDEPEIGLDAPGIRRLQRTLRDLKGSGVGVVLATQDQRLVSACDRIAVLEAGALQSISTAEDLAQRTAALRAVPPKPATRGGQA